MSAEKEWKVCTVLCCVCVIAVCVIVCVCVCVCVCCAVLCCVRSCVQGHTGMQCAARSIHKHLSRAVTYIYSMLKLRSPVVHTAESCNYFEL